MGLGEMLSYSFLAALLISSARGQPSVPCSKPLDGEKYFVSDGQQCDKFHMCNEQGSLAAEQLYGVQCPNTIGELRFGAETDCRAFFTCSVHTKYHPRLAGCPMGTVFNDQKLFCDEPNNVP